MATPEDNQGSLDAEPVDQSDPDQSWYFDVPDGAWERQEQKNRDLRDMVRSNLSDKSSRPKAFSGPGGSESLKEQKGASRDGGKRGMLRRGPAPAPAADGTEAHRKNGGGPFDEFIEGTESGLDAPNVEREQGSSGPLPLRLRRSAGAPDAIDSETAAPAGDAPVSRWDSMFGGPADMSIVDSMKAWTTDDVAPRKQRTLSLRTDPKAAEALNDPARQSEDDGEDDFEPDAPAGSVAPEAAVSDFLARIRNRSGAAPKEAPDTFDIPEPEPDLTATFEAFAVEAPLAFPAQSAPQDFDAYASGDFGSDEESDADAPISNPADIIGGMRAWATGSAGAKYRRDTPQEPTKVLEFPVPPAVREPLAFEQPPARTQHAAEPAKDAPAAFFAEPEADAPVESAGDDIVGGLRAWAMKAKGDDTTPRESRAPRLPLESLLVSETLDWDALAEVPAAPAEPDDTFLTSPLADAFHLPETAPLAFPAIEATRDEAEADAESAGDDIVGGLRAWAMKAKGGDPRSESRAPRLPLEPLPDSETLDWDALAEVPAAPGEPDDRFLEAPVTDVFDLPETAPSAFPAIVASHDEPDAPDGPAGDDIVGGMRAWAMKTKGGDTPRSEPRAPRLPLEPLPVAETLDWDALAVVPDAPAESALAIEDLPGVDPYALQPVTPAFGANAAEYAANPFGLDDVPDEESEWEKPPPVAVKAPTPVDRSDPYGLDSAATPPAADEPLTLWDGAIDDIDAVDRELGGKPPRADGKKKPGLLGKLFGRKKSQPEQPVADLDGGDWLMPDDSGRIDAPKTTALGEFASDEPGWLLADDRAAFTPERQALAEIWQTQTRDSLIGPAPSRPESFESFMNIEPPLPVAPAASLSPVEPVPAPALTSEPAEWGWDTLPAYEPEPVADAVAEVPLALAETLPGAGEEPDQPFSWDALVKISQSEGHEAPSEAPFTALETPAEPALSWEPAGFEETTSPVDLAEPESVIAAETGNAAPGGFNWTRFFKSEDVAEEPVAEVTEFVAEEPVAEVAEFVAEEPVAEVTELVADESVAEVTEFVAAEPVAEPPELDGWEPLNEAFELVAKEPVAVLPEFVAEEPIAAAIDLDGWVPFNETFELVAEEPVGNLPELVAEEPVATVSDLAGWVPFNETLELVAEEPVADLPEYVVEEPVADLPEYVAEEPVAEVAEPVIDEPVATTADHDGWASFDETFEFAPAEPVTQVAELVAEEPAAEAIDLDSWASFDETFEFAPAEPVSEVAESVADTVPADGFNTEMDLAALLDLPALDMDGHTAGEPPVSAARTESVADVEDWWATLETPAEPSPVAAIPVDALDEDALGWLFEPEKDSENAASSGLPHHGDLVMADENRILGTEDEQEEATPPAVAPAKPSLFVSSGPFDEDGWDPEPTPVVKPAVPAFQAARPAILFDSFVTTPEPVHEEPAATVPAIEPAAASVSDDWEPEFDFSFEPEESVAPAPAPGFDAEPLVFDVLGGTAHWDDVLGAADTPAPIAPVASASDYDPLDPEPGSIEEGWSEIALAASAYERAGQDAAGGGLPPVRMNRATFGGYTPPVAAADAAGIDPLTGLTAQPDVDDAGWRAWDADSAPEPAVSSVEPEDPSDEWDSLGNEHDVVLRAFEAHARQAVPEVPVATPEPAELFKYASSEEDDFDGLLGEDADELVSEAGDLAIDEGSGLSKVQGWAPQRAILTDDDDVPAWADRSPVSEGRSNWNPAIARAEDLAPPWATPASNLDAAEDPTAGRRKARSLVRELVETGLLALLVFLSVRASFQNFKVDGSSMFPTLENGEFLIVNKLVYSEVNLEKLSKYVPFVDPGEDPTRNVFHGPQRGDVIVLKHPSHPETDLIKRVIGLPGETIEIKDGHVYVNDALLEEPYIDSPWNDTKPKVRLPAGEYFVMGDNREFSADSRNPQIGLIPEELIIGRTMLSYWPKSKFGLAPNEAGTVQAAITPIVAGSTAPLFGGQSALFFVEVVAGLTVTRFAFRKALATVRA